MFITKKSLPRRTFLQGTGAAIALPLLDAMIPAATALAKTPGAPVTRVGFIYVPHGAHMAAWTPEAAGRGFDFSPSLKPLEPFRDSLVVVSNLKRAGTDAEQHSCSSAWLSAAIPKRTEGEDFRAGTTIDQVLARQISQDVPFPSLEFATEDFTTYVGGCTPGYSCAYMNTISWTSPTTPLPMEINPRAAFERLFGDGGSEADRQRQRKEDRSILDVISGQARTLHASLGTNDQSRMNDYLDNVREIERRVQQAEHSRAAEVELIDKPLGVPETFEEHTALMTDLLAMAFQADLTRVFTFMMSREGSQRTFGEIGVSDPWHVVSHHGDQPEKTARAAKVNALCIQMIARFAEKMRTTKDGDRSLLDSSLVFYGSGMSNSNVHAVGPLPLVALGGGVGTGNRHIVVAPNTENGNLWLAVAQHFGVSIDRFGESTGTVDFF